MSAAPKTTPSPKPGRRRIIGVAGLVVGPALLVYCGSISAPLLFDDLSSIVNNPSVRALWPLSSVLVPPASCTTAGRPLANLSFALNYAWGGRAVLGYHAVNLALHALATLALFGVVRRTLFRLGTVAPGSDLSRRLAADSVPLAFAIAALWSVHPLLTESVTYVSQRTEVLMALFYLLTLYTFIRGAEQSPRRWWTLSILACVAGMASKETMVTAPALVFGYDSVFVAGTARLAWHARWRYYLSVASSWLLLAAVVTRPDLRAVGFGLGVSWWRYALTECEAVLRYLLLAIWPHPLVFDYGAIFMGDAAVAAVLFGVLGTIVAATGVMVGRWPRAGFLAIAFFVLLAPTSSVVPISGQPIAENRMYLPLAALAILFVICLYCCLGRRSWLVLGAVVIAFAPLTIIRNLTYCDEVRLWRDTVAKRPMNPRAYENLGEALVGRGELAAARRCFEAALRLEPNYSMARNNYAATLYGLGEVAAAREQFELVLRSQPNAPEVHDNLSRILFELGQVAAAQAHAEEALRLSPSFSQAHNNLGNALIAQGRLDEARRHYLEAVRLQPDFPQAQMNLGVALRQLGQFDLARRRFEEALRLLPDFPEAHFNLGTVLLLLGRNDSAQSEFETALRLRPDFPEAHNHLGAMLVQLGRPSEARREFEAAIRLRPDYVDARANLARVVAPPSSKP